MKKKLTIDEQIIDIENKGVTFNNISIEEAKSFLKYNNYYFKLKTYARNYPINPLTNKYVNLDFAYLVELSKLDSYLRKIIIDMALDIEHFLKTKMMFDLSKNVNEDGYNIVNKYLSVYPETEISLSTKADSYSICSDLAEKHRDKSDYALWNIVELLSFGKFVELYTLYYQEYNSYNYSAFLGSIKFLRNAAAHNNCLLSWLLKPNGTKKFRKTRQLTNALTKVKNLSETSRVKKMENPVIHDFVALLFVYNDLLKNSGTRDIRDKRMKDLQTFFNSDEGRVKKHKEYFKKNQTIIESYKFISNIIDYIVNQNNNPKHVNFL